MKTIKCAKKIRKKKKSVCKIGITMVYYVSILIKNSKE